MLVNVHGSEVDVAVQAIGRGDVKTMAKFIMLIQQRWDVEWNTANELFKTFGIDQTSFASLGSKDEHPIH